MNLFDVFCETADRQPDAQAVVGTAEQIAWTYRELLQRIETLGEKLASAGLQPGQVVGLHLESGAEYVVASYAIWKCGACVVPIPFELQPNEKRQLIANIAMDAIVSRTAALTSVDAQRSGPVQSIDRSLSCFENRAVRPQPEQFADVNAAFIRFSSGTTSNSKGVVLAHESIFERIHAANEVLQLGPDDNVVWLLSMSYHFAVSIVGYLSFGATIVIPENQFANGILDSIEKYAGTFIYASPVHYQQLAQVRSDGGLNGVRMAVSTTTGLRSETADAFFSRFGLPLTQAYGIIEIGLPCINARDAGQRAEAVGRVSPAYELRLRSDEIDETASSEVRGEIQFRGPGMLDAYYHPWRWREDITDADGWFSTGDIGELSADGVLSIVGRSKELISVGGMKLFPQEVEDVLNAHPAIAESAVYASPKRRLGEVPHARVVIGEGQSATESELRTFCRTQLAIYKVPERIFFVDELARTGSGKIIRREMSEELETVHNRE